FGRFSITWTPDKEGDYTLYAASDDTESYYSSQATSSIAVSSAPATPAGSPPYGWYIVGAAIAIIVAVALVGLLLYRKISK
ncbi:MAG: hypothetical protein LBE76_00055, partial [Nitrososphaerota archaeon]|nr:hypothetical protein [Nitrososphaerota archaeon]